MNCTVIPFYFPLHTNSWVLFVTLCWSVDLSVCPKTCVGARRAVVMLISVIVLVKPELYKQQPSQTVWGHMWGTAESTGSSSVAIPVSLAAVPPTSHRKCSQSWASFLSSQHVWGHLPTQVALGTLCWCGSGDSSHRVTGGTGDTLLVWQSCCRAWLTPCLCLFPQVVALSSWSLLRDSIYYTLSVVALIVVSL